MQSGITTLAQFVASEKLKDAYKQLAPRLEKYKIAKGRSLQFERAECLRLLEIVLESKCVLNLDKTDDLEIKECLISSIKVC